MLVIYWSISFKLINSSSKLISYVCVTLLVSLGVRAALLPAAVCVLGISPFATFADCCQPVIANTAVRRVKGLNVLSLVLLHCCAVFDLVSCRATQDYTGTNHLDPELNIQSWQSSLWDLFNIQATQPPADEIFNRFNYCLEYIWNGIQICHQCFTILKPKFLRAEKHLLCLLLIFPTTWKYNNSMWY